MTTRQTSFRPRKVDATQQLCIVRDVGELDNAELVTGAQDGTDRPDLAGPSGHADPKGGAHGAGASGEDPHKHKAKPKEIPIPEIKFVPTYTREYLPLYALPETYIRGKGGVGWAADEYVEYDLDCEDEDWLETYNAAASKSTGPGSEQPMTALLPDTKFEKMLWRLDLACAEAQERALNAAGASEAERRTPATVANTSHLPRDEALAVLRKTAGGREGALSDVHTYWLAKRKRHGRPLLKSLWAPTAASDSNPFNTFRLRERANRPATRRRRENSAECLEKLRTMRDNLLHALEMSELLVMRERKKREMLRIDFGAQRLQLSACHQSPDVHGMVEAEGRDHLTKSGQANAGMDGRLGAYLQAAALQQPPGMAPAVDYPLQREVLRKRKLKALEAEKTVERVNKEAVAKLPQPPTRPADTEMCFTMRPDPERLPATLPMAMASLMTADPDLMLTACSRRCWRVARGGRLMLTRVDPLTGEKLAAGAKPPPAGHPLSLASLRAPPLPDSRLGALPDWWGPEAPGRGESDANGGAGGSGADGGVSPLQRDRAPWACVLDLADLPLCVDGELLLRRRQMQLQQHHAEGAQLGALAGEKLGLLGSANPGALAQAATSAMGEAAAALAAQLAEAVAGERSAVERRSAQQQAAVERAAAAVAAADKAKAGGGGGSGGGVAEPAAAAVQ
ncbi:hypothetical protein FOA52_000371 [Chlamydomonas sp. UWO 241]|nr:hypothetical protein FOA52_000371 [Chlamydomonas sp. UWO 241]